MTRKEKWEKIKKVGAFRVNVKYKGLWSSRLKELGPIIIRLNKNDWWESVWRIKGMKIPDEYHAMFPEGNRYGINFTLDMMLPLTEEEIKLSKLGE